jgi:lipopolysaccharide transport system ATP-binding protein
VRGEVHALLQIGSGFHPDFTGRENVYGYLAYLGISGKEADRRFAEIVEFSELEEYIEQPLKTYSTGMAVRLMFSTSTMVAPDILVLDEVLSVGDAYFSYKSFEKIRELSEYHRTTLLLVSHDMYSAIKLCPRVIWLDRGQILIDGDAPTVVKAYEDSIRDQEEQRFRKRKQNRLEEIAKETPSENLTYIIVEFRSRNNQPQPCPVYFSSVELLQPRGVLASLPLASDASNDKTSHLHMEGSTWGKPVVWQGRPARPMLNFGTSFHKAAGVFCIPNPVNLRAYDLQLAVEYWSDEHCEIVVRAFYGNKQFDLGDLPIEPGVWKRHIVPCPLKESTAVSIAETFLKDVSLGGVHGSGKFGVTNVAVLDDEGNETHVVSHGSAAQLRIQYVLRDADFNGGAQVLIALHRDGIQDVCRFITRDLTFSGSQPSGTIYFRVPKVGLANGRYTVTVMIAKEGYYDRDQVLFFSINPDVYVCVSRIIEFNVVNAGLAVTGTVVLAEGQWWVEPHDRGRDICHSGLSTRSTSS